MSKTINKPIDTLSESALAQALGQEANLALPEKAVNHKTSRLRDDISHLKVLSQNIQRSQNELTSSLHPSSRIVDQIQSADQQRTFIKTMEYYMYSIRIQFEAKRWQELFHPLHNHYHLFTNKTFNTITVSFFIS